MLTDLEFYELRYSGKAASAVRGFRAVYLGLFFNCIIMATVNLAACKIAAILFGLERWQTLLAVGLLNVIFATYSGLWGVLVIDTQSSSSSRCRPSSPRPISRLPYRRSAVCMGWWISSPP